MSSLPNPNLLQSLMTNLHLQAGDTNPDFDPSFERFLLGEDDSDDEIRPYQDGKQAIYLEETRLEAEIIRRILTGRADTMKPNSGEAIPIRENSVCVGCHEDEDGEYLVWEWHGHIMCYTDERGFAPEYVYGNYFQKLATIERVGEPTKSENVAETTGNQGLRDLIGDTLSTTPARILHRNVNAGSSRF
ncbi:uncharacterized protein [Cicer arietinum]|uniref:Uncharacterized protein LOC101499143 n=1 Tax=Cicer arietinum TaxID=3827 RepID=A0A1S2XSJ7_CICAR|nr:uncharacterized protein LOC101499143 [Cicer arietinum]